MIKQLPLRQRVRKALVILAFLSFPITMNYLSPYVIIDGASRGIVSGSFIMFGLMFISSLFLGRAWCGWICPGGGVQEVVEPVNSKPVRGRRLNWIKGLIWIPWVSLIIWLVIRAGGYQKVDFFLDTVNGFSVAGTADRPILFAYIVYYLVIGLFTVLAVIFGRRAGCHTICWMAPFMILGRWLRNRLAWPSLRLKSDTSRCTNCMTCTRQCPMSLDVNAMVQKNAMENSECILCVTCVDHCPEKAIHVVFSKGR